MSTVNKNPEKVEGAEPDKMTFEEFFIDIMWNEYDTHTLFYELAFSDEYCSHRIFHWCLKQAKRHHITLTDADTYDYDELLFESYKESLRWNRK